MSKTFLRTLCAILCLILCIPIFSSCGYSTIYELGPYELTEDEYAYLLCTYKRQVLEGMGLDEAYLDYPVNEDNSITYGEYIERMYREEFEQSVYTLIYAQALFEEYGLELSEEEQKSIESVAKAVIHANANTTTAFDNLVEDYGFSHETLYSIYEKQAKESAVINYLCGSNYSKVTDEDKNDYYEENYIRFQVLVVNTLYTKNDNGTFSNLTEEERKTKLQLQEELIQFLSRENLDYDYKLIPKILKVENMSNVTYEDLWNNEYINDDKTYPGGMYMAKPNAYQMSTVNTLSQAMLTKEGDVSALAAKRYFDGEGSLVLGDSQEQINKGDYFEYGTAFIKRLPIEEKGWKKEENKDFFSDSVLAAGASRQLIAKAFNLFQKSTAYTLMVDKELVAEYSLATIPANYIDYDYFHPSSSS